MQLLRSLRLNHTLMDNVYWFAGSLLLAFFIWVIAINQSVEQRVLDGTVTVDVLLDEDVIVVNSPNLNARVSARANRAILDTITVDDVHITADLRGLEPGRSYRIPLVAEIDRQAIVEPQPGQIQFTIETVERRQKPVVIVARSDPPADIRVDELVPEVSQVLVSGPQSRVEQVTEVRAIIDLAGQRSTFTQQIQLVPMDESGRRVTNVTVEPVDLMITAQLSQRDDIREFPVRPNFLLETLPDGYVLSSMSYDPHTVFISGSPTQLSRIQSTLQTEPIDLTGRTESFEINVGVQIPVGVLLISEESQVITVNVDITALTAADQIDNIAIEIIGLPDGAEAQITPATVSVYITGPQPVVEALTDSDIRVVVDVDNLQNGTYDVEPVVLIQQGQLETNILPATVNITISGIPETTPEATP